MLKNILIVLILLFSIAGIKAQNSNFVLFSENQEPFTLLMNEFRINRNPVSNVKVTGLQPATYSARILFNNPGLPQIEVDLDIAADRELTYALVQNQRGERMLIFVNEFSLGYNPIPPSKQEVVAYTGPISTPSGSIVEAIQPNSGNNSGFVDPAQPEGKPFVEETFVIEEAVVVETVQPQEVEILPGYNGKVGCENMIAEADLISGMVSIEDASFSSSKMTIAKQFTQNSCLLADQVRQVIELFDFETDRLNYAKFAYDYTYDQGNYFKVNDALNYSSSIMALEEYLLEK